MAENAIFTEDHTQLEEAPLNNVPAEMKIEYGDIKINGLLEFGPLADWINKVVDDNKIDLIVMGTKGETVALNNVFGSVAYHVINNVDAREKNEYDISHIKNAVWCGYNEFNLNRLSSISEKANHFIVYCADEFRSENVTQKIVDAGYSHVSKLYGGIFEWINQRFPVYNDSGVQTQKVFAYSKDWEQWLTKGQQIYE